MSRRFYVHQFDTIWSFPESGFRALLAVGARAGGYDLDNPRYQGQRLAGRFSCGRFNDSTAARSLHVPRRFREAYFISPLDWSQEDFREELERFLKKKRESAISKRITLLSFTYHLSHGYRSRCCRAPVLVLGDNGARRNSRRIQWVRCTECEATGWAGDREYVPAPTVELLLPWQNDDCTARQG